MTFSLNGLVAQLSPADQAMLLKRSHAAELKAGQILSQPDSADQHVYFLTSASVALVVLNGHRAGLAVGLAGHEGAVGLQFALGLGAGNLTLMVQSAGTGWRTDGAELQRLLQRRAAMLMTFSRYIWSVAQEVATLAAASQVQDIKARLAGWILISGERSRQQDLVLTHAHLADMLGVRRASITLAAVELKEQGLLDYQRGRIQILDRRGLEALAYGPLSAT